MWKLQKQNRKHCFSFLVANCNLSNSSLPVQIWSGIQPAWIPTARKITTGSLFREEYVFYSFTGKWANIHGVPTCSQTLQYIKHKIVLEPALVFLNCLPVTTEAMKKKEEANTISLLLWPNNFCNFKTYKRKREKKDQHYCFSLTANFKANKCKI